ncbi:MAG: hypothetical protein QT11_C0001G0358 [archaeon GW2011_AR20]|nr:MAG: hypothetical protein QT11_C0001G0358 [archaeon GW2011_AR20]AQS28034.1 hypothetical protein [uncultured archaeon]AQS28526.1 hypothetical protein [uncultured archaeon]AQS28636.1 hypothetical protein [uncultured archaeon]MBS3160366.1 hypothetical protein [Candidatus Woesearchaeota archaeon]
MDNEILENFYGPKKLEGLILNPSEEDVLKDFVDLEATFKNYKPFCYVIKQSYTGLQ